MARFNAMLNRVDNVEAVEGDLFEPAGDLRFDLIVSNPPFVVSPEDGVLYRDSGMAGDEICKRIIREAPAHLAEGGFAQVLCNWVRIAGQDWLERLVGWFAETDCDAWVIHNKSVHTADYAQHWLGQADSSQKDQFAARFDRWMAYYDRQGIEAIDYGLIILRRRAAEHNWARIDHDCELNYPSGEGIVAIFAARDLLARLEDVSSLLSLRLRCRPSVRLSQRLRPADSGWTVDGADCVLGDRSAVRGGGRSPSPSTCSRSAGAGSPSPTCSLRWPPASARIRSRSCPRVSRPRGGSSSRGSSGRSTCRCSRRAGGGPGPEGGDGCERRS